MSIIADALKKAQRIGVKPVEGLPPFDLKKEGGEPAVKAAPVATATQAAAAPRAIPLTQTAAPRTAAALQAASVIATAAPAPATTAPRPTKPVAAQAAAPDYAKAAAKPAAKPKAPRKLWSWRIPVLVVFVLGLAAGALYYVNKVYLPGLSQGGMSVSSAPLRQESAPAPAPAPEAAAPNDSAADSAQAVQPTDSTATAAAEAAGSEAAPAETAETAAETPAREHVARIRPAGEQKSYPAGATAPVSLPPGPPTGNLPAPAEQPPLAETVAQGPGETTETPTTAAPRGEIVPRDREATAEIRPDIYHFNMAVYFQRNGDIQSALDQYQKVIDISPYNAEAFSNMGVLYNQVGEYGKAVSVLQKALLIDPRYSKAHNNLGLAYYRSGQYEQARSELERAVQLEPSSQDSYNNLGLVYRKTSRSGEAEQAFQRAIALDPTYGAAHYNLALLYDETGRLDRAIEEYRSFLNNGGGSPEINARVRERLLHLGAP
ncbi:tetratricopeptide repeat protein [bacterium]|nr:tetratricopeptide repeat protein [bacterium]